MDITSDKQAKSHLYTLGYGLERETLGDNLNLFR